MGKAINTCCDNLGYFNPPNVYRPAIIDIRIVGEYSAEDGATNTYRITQNDGKIFEFDVKNGSGGSAGRSVTSVEQIQVSTESLGKNVARIRLSDGTYTDVEIRNGAQGEVGPQGQRGPAGIDSVEASIGTNDPTQAPSVDKDLNEGVLSLTFNNIKGEKGDQGEPAVAVENYVTAEATSSTTSATDVLPATGSSDTVYRVSNWDGTQYNTNAYTEYGWYDGAYKMLATRTPGIDDEPTAGSQKLVKSGGVAAQISQLGQKCFNGVVSGWQSENALFTTGVYTGKNYILICRNFENGYVGQIKIFTIGSEYTTGKPYIQYRVYNGNVWNDWQEYDGDKKFKRGDIGTSELDGIFESGIYKYSTGAIVIVAKYSGDNIRQVRLSPSSGGGMFLQHRTYNGSTWGNWADYINSDMLFDGYYTTDALDTITSGGVYKVHNLDPNTISPAMLIVRRNYNNSIIQTRILSTSSAYIQQRISLDGGVTWSEWQDKTIEIPDYNYIGQKINGQLVTLENMPNLVSISDGLKVLASGECNFYHEVATGLMYVVAVEGNHNAYEANDYVSLYVYSLTNPNLVKRFEIASRQQGCYTGNIIPLGNRKVRVFYSLTNEDVNGGYAYYRDFDFSNETLTNPEKVQLNGDDLKATDIRDYTISKGYSEYGSSFVYLQKITEEMSDGYRYATCSCAESINCYIAIIRSNDNFATCELFDVVPFASRYDCAVAGLGNKLYFVHRIAGDEYASTSGTALCVGEIGLNGMTNWSIDTKFAEGDSRPDCYYYDGNIYLMAGDLHSVSSQPMRVSSSVYEGTSDNPSNYIKVLQVKDTRGVQNPRVFRFGAGDYGVLMQNSPARIDYENGYQGQWQFKTAVCFVHTRLS